MTPDDLDALALDAKRQYHAPAVLPVRTRITTKYTLVNGRLVARRVAEDGEKVPIPKPQDRA